MSLYSTVRPRHWYSKIGFRFLEAIDLSENLVRFTKALKSLPNGIISFILANIAWLPTIGFGALAWYFDIDSTWTAIVPVRDAVYNRLVEITVTGWLALLVSFMVQAVPWALTLLPTATEMLGSKFAKFDIAVFQWATWFFVVMDAASDIPRVNALMLPYWPSFVGEKYATVGFWGILFSLNLKVIGAALGYHALWVLALFGASYFLELAAVLSLWAVVGLYWKSIGYWLIKLLASNNWTRQFNRVGGFSDDSVRGGSVPQGRRPAPEPDGDDDIDEDDVDTDEVFDRLGSQAR